MFEKVDVQCLECGEIIEIDPEINDPYCTQCWEELYEDGQFDPDI